MTGSTIRYFSYPLTQPPPDFADDVASVFRKYEDKIGTEHIEDGLTSDEVLSEIRPELVDLGFNVESGKAEEDKIRRPVLFGEDGEADLQYYVDAYNESWKCGLEVEAGRAWKGNAIYRDLVQALVMVKVEVLILAVPNVYKYRRNNRISENPAFDKTRSVIETLFSTHRFSSPYDVILIGY